MMFLRSIAVCTLIIVWSCLAYAGGAEGIVKSFHEVDLAFQLDGVVARVLVKEGTKVDKGEPLIQLDDAIQKLEVTRREAILADRSEIESNRKNLGIVKEIMESSRNLYSKLSAVSRDEVLNLEMQYHTLMGKIDIAEARKKQEQIEFSIAREMLSRYILNSPVSGTVISVKREPGEWSKSGETVVTVVDTSTCFVEFNVEERNARNLHVNRQVTIRVREGDSLVSKTGKITYVAPVADKASALVRVKVEFENRNGKVVPGVLAYMDLR